MAVVLDGPGDLAATQWGRLLVAELGHVGVTAATAALVGVAT